MINATNQINPLTYIKALHRATDGYITLFKKLADNKVMQRHYKLEQLNDEIIRNYVDYDCYVSLNSFYRTKRGNKHLRTIHNLYVDLDCYNVGLTPEQVLAALESDYFNRSIPLPNIVLYSGRGLGLIWHTETISGLALERWGIVQRAIYEQLKDFGADPAVVSDGARIFRLPASINSKSNEIVRYDVLHDYQYDIKSIGAEYFGILPKQPREKAQKRRSTSKKKAKAHVGFNPYSLAQARLNDLEILIKLRDGKMNGHRERLLFLARYFALTITKNKEAAVKKIEYLNGLFAMPLSQSELANATTSAETYFEGNGINFTNERLIEWFAISSDEQKHLSTIIGRTEKRERDRVAKEKARRNAGTDTRAKYNRKRLKSVIRNAKRIKLAQAIYPNMSIRETAARVGLSKTYVAELLKDLETYVDSIEQVSYSTSVYINRVATGLEILGLEIDLSILSKCEILMIQQQLTNYLRNGSLPDVPLV